MNSKANIRFTDRIVTRLILFALGFILIGSALRYWSLEGFMREDLVRVVSAQQEALARDMAVTVDYQLAERQRMLRHLASTLPVDLLKDQNRLRAWLAERYELHPLFQRLLVLNPEGNALADYPVSDERKAMNYADRDYFQGALSGGLTIGSAVLGRVTRDPMLPMAMPIREANGTVLAILVGATGLNASDFLNSIHQGKIGETGGYLVISPKEQMFIAATEPGLALKPTPPPGVNVLHDRALAGFRGSGITVNAEGMEMIAAFASVPSTGWFVVARISTKEALALLSNSKSMLLRSSIVVSVFLLFLLSLTLALMFGPLRKSAEQAIRMTRGEQQLQALPVSRLDEVGYLIAAFNSLLDKLLATQADLTRMARRDTLTGLSNRLDLADQMRQVIGRAQRKGNRFAALYLDLDGFKPVNDVLGHQAGDAALTEVARRLSANVREVDVLARVGGDEFVILLGDLEPELMRAQAAAVVVATKCIAAIQAPMMLEGELRILGLSIGIALGDDRSSTDALLSAADNAMYTAKKSGGNRFVMAGQATSLVENA